MKHPEMTPVQSSNLQSIGYDDNGLWVRFTGGGLYRYPMASRQLYEDGLKAESAGRWFRDHVRGKLEHLKIGPEEGGHAGRFRQSEA